jgi:adenosine deaminase CECR1
MLRRASVLFSVVALAACASRAAVISPVPAQEQPTDAASYREARTRLIERERALRLGASLVLTAEEETANRSLLALKQTELDRTRTFFPAAHSFLDNRVKALMAGSPVLEVMRRMPKGGILHSHGSASGDFRWLIAHATYRADAYIYLGTAAPPVHGALRISKQPPGEGWRPISEMRAAALDAKTFDEELYRSITLGEEDRSTPNIWDEFSRCFQRFSGLLYSDRSVLDEYWRHLLRAMIDENIQYLETRHLPISDAVVHAAQIRDPDFRIHYIATGGRSATRERLAQTLGLVLEQRTKDPRIVGFDLIEEEDRTNSNLFFLEELLAARQAADRRGIGLPLYLHSGETNWAENENVYDAILLGATRIGHGLALIKHPLLMDMVKARGIAIEICPISNQLLDYIPDLRNHPAVHYINAGLPIVLSPDDPAIMQHSLSHDFYVAFMAWGLDLKALKQISINSLTYSAMSADEKQRAVAAWERRWTVFVKWVNERASAENKE